ncbi:MAG: T9SS type A sorting domain-containing protein [Flavobacteriales bacterium]|nr:T9SS type A sorting domain-containing protein [Flavobacteriales bacterium]MCB9197023.1 T9SS type A sorting domain-containing protein [Flavobacteriales bacterium]
MKRFLFLVIATWSFSSAKAQVISYDYSPDEVLNATYAGESILIDFNGDQNPELTIYGSKNDTAISGFPVTITGFAIGTMGNTEIAGSTRSIGSETILEADTLLLAASIDGTLNYVNSSTPSVFPGVGLGADAGGMATIGKYSGKGMKYVGVKFEISGSVHYGWIRLSVNASSTICTVDAYGYETTANTPIQAGELNSGFLGVETVDIAGKVLVKGESLQFLNLEGSEVIIYNMLGEVQSTVRVNSENKTVLIDQMESGIYLIQCKKGDKLKTFKVLKS